MLIRKISKTNILIKFQNKIKFISYFKSQRSCWVSTSSSFAMRSLPLSKCIWDIVQKFSKVFYLRCCFVAKLYLTLCDPMNCSPPGSSVHRISQARILEWAAISFSRGSSLPRDGSCLSCLACRFFTTEAIGKPVLSMGTWIYKNDHFVYMIAVETFCQNSFHN